MELEQAQTRRLCRTYQRSIERENSWPPELQDRRTLKKWRCCMRRSKQMLWRLTAESFTAHLRTSFLPGLCRPPSHARPIAMGRPGAIGEGRNRRLSLFRQIGRQGRPASALSFSHPITRPILSERNRLSLYRIAPCPSTLLQLILSAHGFNIDRIDPSFPAVVRRFKDARKAASLQVVKARTGNRGDLRDFIKNLTILDPGYTSIPLPVPRADHARLVCRGLEAPCLRVGVVNAISLCQHRRPA